jgi:tRNA U34 5-methylaminomethyl-2-thiouridine-forming methyltransferase MnmC
MQKTNQQPFYLGTSDARFLLDTLECDLIRTADGSPSLRYRERTSEHWTEPMHSSKGAWSETLCVYEPALMHSLTQENSQRPVAIASIGLGLGYNELLSAGLALQQKRHPNNIALFSFESQPALRFAFEAKFKPNSEKTLPQALSSAFDDILERVCAHFAQPKCELQRYVAELFTNQNFQMLGALDKDTLLALQLPEERCRCILFDAFSPDSSPDLWSEPLLEQMVEVLCAERCIFTSYASRTGLKKILKAQGFDVKKVSGFAGKRERTLALRETRPPCADIKKGPG